MIRWLLGAWRARQRARQRAIDLDILWPECKRQAEAREREDRGPEIPALDLAKAAFMTHCANDRAWTRDYGEAELVDFIDRLR
jgi:hypothetical protein